MNIYTNIASFIRFSGIDPNYVNMLSKDFDFLVMSKLPIDIVTKDTLVRLYFSNTKQNDVKQIFEFVRRERDSYKTIIIVKQTWTAKGNDYGAIRMLHSDFAMDISEINAKFEPFVMKDDCKDLDFYHIKKESLPEIKEDDILAKWLIAKKGNVIGYYINTENGRYLSYRVVT